MFRPERIYSFDSETDNSGGHGLNPLKARITDLSLATGDGGQVFNNADEASMLVEFDAAVRGLPAGLLSTWNGTHFDLPFLDTRFEKARITEHGMMLEPTPQFPPKYELIPGHDSGYTCRWMSRTGTHVHLDIAYAFKPIAERLGVTWGLKPVAEALGFHPVSLDRERLHEYTDADREEYALSDARVTRQLTCWLLGVDVALGMGQQTAQPTTAA